MISTVLVAGRGEIARRVFRTCRELGIGTVAVFADPDEGAPHAIEADCSVRLPGAAPAETYLRGDLIVAAARAAGADAVHPGYGFLAENAGFARAVIDAGLTWIGPPPAAIEAMGVKIGAKKLMAAAGVPVLPDLDPATADADFDEHGPLLVKASAGGGGRGIRVVRTAGELPGAVASAQREAQSAFGDPTVFCEPLLEPARHVEVQILADQHGTVWALGERECSIQRRHQKIIEEAPSPAVTPGLRTALGDTAMTAARAIGYIGAGTVEFLLDPDGGFFFLEMNTRLQVEHPVTECVYGLDLVRLQIEIAEGAALPARPPAPHGHAVEARLYAEDPAQDWRPASGRLHTFEIPGVNTRFSSPVSPSARYGVRLDSGVAAGDEVGVHYDPMLAKVIAWAPTRHAAARRLASALTGARLHGLTTNRDLLVNVLRHEEFLAGDIDTTFLERHDLTAPLADEVTAGLSALAAALAEASLARMNARVLGGLPSGWRNVVSQPQRKAYEGPVGTLEIEYRLTRDGRLAEGAVRGAPPLGELSLVRVTPEVVLDVDGVRRTFTVVAVGDAVYVDSALGAVTLRAVPRFPDPSAQVAPGSLLAPMPGTVVRVAVARGDPVERGQPVLWLEAMKMEHQIVAPAAGVVGELQVEAGQQVDAGALLAIITPES